MARPPPHHILVAQYNYLTHARTHAVVERMQQMKVIPDVRIFTALIKLCGRRKDVVRSYQVLELMNLFDVRPDEHVYSNLISASARARCFANFFHSFSGA